jgi:hypothetical protein
MTPNKNLVGEEKRGFKIVMSCLDMGCIVVAARPLGPVQAFLYKVARMRDMGGTRTTKYSSKVPRKYMRYCRRRTRSA